MTGSTNRRETEVLAELRQDAARLLQAMGEFTRSLEDAAFVAKVPAARRAYGLVARAADNLNSARASLRS